MSTDPYPQPHVPIDSRFEPLFDNPGMLRGIDLEQMFDILVDECHMKPGPWHDPQMYFRRSMLGSARPVLYVFASVLQEDVRLAFVRIGGRLRIIAVVGAPSYKLATAIERTEEKLETFDTDYLAYLAGNDD